MPAAKKTTRKRATRKKKARAKIKKLGLLIAEACREAARELPNSTPEERREWVVSLLNEKLDLPVLNEVQEAVLLGMMVDVITDLLFREGFSDHRKELTEVRDLIAKLRK